MKFEAFSGPKLRDKKGLIDTDRLQEEAEAISEDRLREEETSDLVDGIMDGETLTPPKVNTEMAERDMKSEPPNAEVKVEMPASGDIELLEYPTIPLSSGKEPFDVEYDGEVLSYVLEVGDATVPEINSEIEDRQHMLSFHPDNSEDKIEQKNKNARRAVRRVIRRRKEEIKSEEEKLEEILDADEDDDEFPRTL